MNKEENNSEKGATVVITHHVSAAQQPQYEAWLSEIGPVCKASQGLLDWHIIRPITGLTNTYTVIIRYDNHDHLKNWIESEDRERLLSKIENVLANKEDVHINSGLDFLFSQVGEKPKTPVRWKQFLLTWSAIFPLVFCLPLLLLPILRWLNVPNNHLLNTLIVTGAVVSLMVYVVMPRYTKLVRRWLFA
ncbi:MAG TPA: antibiotic biosynthesis monooxygenase [Methylotenera sp.]|nr:antibiotic biosynthesis monooxygenase [Methylotenera sp.]